MVFPQTVPTKESLMDYITIEIAKDEGRLLHIGEMYQALAQVQDNRNEKGKRYTVGILLIVFILAKLCGENTLYGMAEWAKMRAAELQNLFGGQTQQQDIAAPD